jgi:hypothetical protein
MLESWCPRQLEKVQCEEPTPHYSNMSATCLQHHLSLLSWSIDTVATILILGGVELSGESRVRREE